MQLKICGGKEPFIEFAERSRACNVLQFARKGKLLLENWLLLRFKTRKLCKAPKESAAEEVAPLSSLLCEMSRVLSWVNPARSEGKLPLKPLLESKRIDKLVSEAKSAGIPPVRKLLDKSSDLSAVSIPMLPSGMDPFKPSPVKFKARIL